MKNNIIPQIVFDYEDEEADYISECLTTLIETVEGTVPGNRQFGLNSEYLSYPQEEAENLFAIDLSEKVDEFMPEIQIIDTQFNMEIDGKVHAIVTIGKGDEGDDD